MILAPQRVGGRPTADVLVRVPEGSADLMDLAAWMRERTGQVLGLDIETNALDPWHEGFRARTVQVADESESWVVPVDGESAPRLSAVVRDHPLWAAHYAEADIRFALRGLPGRAVRLEDSVPHVADTQVLLAVLDPRTVTTHSKKDRIHPLIPRPRGLKEVTARLLSPALMLAEERLHARFRELAPKGQRTPQACVRWGFANCDVRDPAFVAYAGLDPAMTVRLWHLLARQLQQVGRWRRAVAALREQWMTDRMTYAGLQVDGPYAWWLDGQLADVAAARAAQLAARGVAPSGMGPAVGLALEALGERSGRRTDQGAASWDRAALEPVAARADGSPGAELAAAVLDVRRAGKFRAAYVAPMLDAVTLGDGALHCSKRAIGTVTTRSAAQRPALDQLPKRDTRVRAAVRAERGCVLVSCDLRQGEPFVMAALSGDEAYLRDLEAGDINSTIAAMVYGDAYDPARGKEAGTPHYLMRQACKFAWLAACYGARPRKVATLLGQPEERGEEILGRWHAAYPKLWGLADELNGRAVLRLDGGALVPLWDRFYVTPDGELHVGPRPSRLGLNAATQGAQADLLKVSMHRLDHLGWAWALRFHLHDELLLSVPEWMAPEAVRVLERCMTITYRGVTVRCEAKVEGRTWLPQPRTFDRAELAAVEGDD